ncbi:MAG: HNH endonuclease [Candidatus Falkowbacteria bacterium]
MLKRLFKSKKVTIFQNYENYWKLTLEYTDIHGKNFIGTLKIIVDFIDSHDMTIYDKNKYNDLRREIIAAYPKVDMGSVRKSINQFVKLGFINYQLKNYHEFAKEFLEAKTNRKRRSLYSRIVYSNSSFSRSVKNDSDKKEINFLLKTLEEVGKLHKEDIVGLMTIDVSKVTRGYFTSEEVIEAREYAQKIKFKERKYNQIGYLFGILKKLDDLMIIDDYLCFEEDAQVMFAEELRAKTRVRDGYLHRIFKNQLKNETDEKLGDIKCMLEKLSYPSLVASHIKPFVISNNSEAYDPNNGLLLSRNMDVLFDRGYISFKNNGNIILSHVLTKEVSAYLKNYKLDGEFINDGRLKYLSYHRSKIFKS